MRAHFKPYVEVHCKPYVEVHCKPNVKVHCKPNIDVHCKPVGVEPGLWGDVREGPHARAGHRQDTSSSIQFIAVHDSSWQFISVHDSSWQFMTVHDSSLYFIIMCENSRWSLTTYCSSSYIPWQFMTFHGNIRLTKAILDKKQTKYGNSRWSMAIYVQYCSP